MGSVKFIRLFKQAQLVLASVTVLVIKPFVVDPTVVWLIVYVDSLFFSVECDSGYVENTVNEAHNLFIKSASDVTILGRDQRRIHHRMLH
ncbi:hypothetical protein RRG08_016336 [Elysia crispata]|uniref:Uncharacterized protein n=1 Tax=Elysia crispata TaxID=231223 RepID=A0AAE0YF86_9GAST|nr:hypothetical protein RRG08_016336 [Elysia crispata]